MTTPIPDLPEVPLPSQNRPDFEETVETFLLGLQPWADAANVLGGEMEALRDDVETIAGGLASLFIQDTEPTVTATQYLWLDTSGPNLVLYFEDGL